MSRFFDNTEKAFLNVLRDALKTANHIDICVGYFNLGGWLLIDDLVDRFFTFEKSRCRLLVGIRPKETEIYETLIRGVLPTQEDKLLRFTNQLRLGEIELKFTLKSDIHAKLYLIYQKESKIATTAFLGSSNLTYSGLEQRLGELNARFDSPEDCQELQQWFDKQWCSNHVKDFSQDLAELILEEQPHFAADLIKDLAHFFIEWEVDYLNCNGFFYPLDEYITFNPREEEYEISPEFEPFIKGLIKEYGARGIELPWYNNPNCETLMDIVNRDEHSDSYLDRDFYLTLKHLAEKDD
jgi:HKD family nuclease